VVHPRPGGHLDSEWTSHDLLEVRADRIKGREALRSRFYAVMTSEPFVKFVRENKITGVDFLWCPDKGKYAAPQWYVAFGTEFIGRGVDHPWFDPATRGQYVDDSGIIQPTDPQWIRGVNRFTNAQLRPDPETDPPSLGALLQEVRQIPSRYSILIDTPLRVLGEFLPDTDFAYARIAQPEKVGADPLRTVRLCATAATRDRLLKARLAKPEDFTPIEILDAAPTDTAIFDSHEGPRLRGAFTPDQLAKLRKAETKLLAKHQAKPKPPVPVVPPEIKRVLPKLKRRLKAQGADIPRGAAPESIAAAATQIGLPIPARWAALLTALDGFDIDNCSALDGTSELHISPASQLPETHRSARSMIASRDRNFPKTRFGVATTDIGDRIFLDTANLTPQGDCPVLHVDHETLETAMAWPAIGLFLEDAARRSDEEE
jgi:hypothetical protein